MGGGIAQVAAQISKKKVILVDLNQKAVDKALAFMGAFCSSSESVEGRTI